MADEKNAPPQRNTGWIVAAIVAVVAVCAVSFMVSQRPQEAIAVSEGDPKRGAPQRTAPTTQRGAPNPSGSIRRTALTPGGSRLRPL